jgi:hypothetical protein
MWLLTSLLRPDRIRGLVDSYAWGDHSPVILTLSEKDARLGEYIGQSWPESWRIETVPMLGNGPTYNEMLRRYPNEPQYGFLADDQILRVPGMLRELERRAGDWRIAYPDDGHWQANLPTMPCIGGELVRTVGFLAPEALVHWAIDTNTAPISGMSTAIRCGAPRLMIRPTGSRASAASAIRICFARGWWAVNSRGSSRG